MIEVYIGTDRLDTYKDEDINITLNIPVSYTHLTLPTKRIV